MDYRAMENWGCIFYFNKALMPGKFLEYKERKSVARTNMHELSHMWFGNLVSME
jgi:aminopeptidase 2